MLAKVEELLVEERRRGVREDDLAAVRSRGDPRSEVDVVSDVALRGDQRCPRVQPDPNLDRSLGEGVGEAGRSRERFRCRREGEEEGVPLGIDFDPSLRRTRLAYDSAMLGQRVGVRLSAQ